ncbi:MAG: hypothetical protein KUG76_07390 [Gammaproteobacteria bacterium]|nr:hypothetical protein [Gammaproteobacteria bacterium]
MEKVKVDEIMKQLSGKLEERKVSDRRSASNADTFEDTSNRRKKSNDRRDKAQTK